MNRGVWLWVLGACGGGAPTPDLGTTETGDTAVESSTDPSGPLACEARAEAPLLVDCTIDLPVADSFTVQLDDGEGSVREQWVEDPDVTEVTLWRLRPDTVYAARVLGEDGEAVAETTVRTGELPAYAQLQTTVTGTASSPYVLAPIQCSGPSSLVLINTSSGEVEWLQRTDEGIGGANAVEGFAHTEDDTLLLLAGRNLVREYSWTGEKLLELSTVTSLEGNPVHHDVERRDGLTYVLSAHDVVGTDGLTYVMDQVQVLDKGQVVETWRLSDHVDPSGWGGDVGFWNSVFPGAHDFAHLNSIEFDTDGNWILSSRRFSSVFVVDRQPGSATFGQIIWNASEGDTPFSDPIRPASDGWSDQHHVNVDPDGHYVMFDNLGMGQLARVARWDIDPVSSQAVNLDSWEMGETCFAQGGAEALSNGNVLATCATSWNLREFHGGEPDPHWTLSADCESGIRIGLMVRAYALW